MKRKNTLQVLMAGILIVPLFSIVVSAQQDSTANTTAEPTTQKTRLQERLEQRKDRVQKRLSVAETKNLETRCKASQGPLGKVRGKHGSVQSTRMRIHNGLVERLSTLSSKLQAKNLDVTELNIQITTLKSLVNAFEVSFGEYKTAVADATEMDCVSDPVAFKASLEEARSALTKARQDSVAIKEHIKTKIKPELQVLRTQLGVTKQKVSNE